MLADFHRLHGGCVRAPAVYKSGSVIETNVVESKRRTETRSSDKFQFKRRIKLKTSCSLDATNASDLCMVSTISSLAEMDRGWFIGNEKILPSKSGQPLSRHSSVSRPCMTVNLTEMLKADKPNAQKKTVPIRPPSPRVTLPKGQKLNQFLSCEPTPKPIIRQRSRSLPSATEKKKKKCRNVGVRFVDSLGLDLEDVRLFRSGEDPFVPQHVTFKLLMGAEMADGRHLEISLPYLKPVFAQQPGDEPGFLHRLHEQKVCLERVLCFELGVIGVVQVLNLNFEKDVGARYSFTEWKSFTETKASWVTTVTKTWEGGGEQLSCDTFRFHLPVPPFLKPGAVLEFAIIYRVCGVEYWDNNDGENYKLVCKNYKLTVPKECEDSMVHFI